MRGADAPDLERPYDESLPARERMYGQAMSGEGMRDLSPVPPITFLLAG
jgi:hypothetical protein